jgi:diphthamide synthase (EF-2-diphthine--ammonia ligase)
MLIILLKKKKYDIVGTLTTLTDKFKRVSMQGVCEELLDLQNKQTGLRCNKSYISWPCSYEIYQEKMLETTERLKADDISHVIFGDLFLEDVRKYRINQMEKAKMECVFPLWKKDTTLLAQEIIDCGLRSILTYINPKKLDISFTGHEFGPELLRDRLNILIHVVKTVNFIFRGKRTNV